MMKQDKQAAVKDASTEEKILAAARKIFTQRGFAATKVRDIAAEADINLSLVNYYFRSKEKLFEVIMLENLNLLFAKVFPMLNNEAASLQEKMGFMATHYIDMLLETPDFATFIVNEVLSGSNKLPAIAHIREQLIQSHFAKQVFALRTTGQIKFDPFQVLMNFMSMLLTPFLARNLLGQVGVSPEGFKKLMEERKQLIPTWINAIITS